MTLERETTKAKTARLWDDQAGPQSCQAEAEGLSA